MLVIPAIDLQQGQCVRLRQGQFEQVSIYEDTPLRLAQRYALQGAKHLHIVDLDGAKTGEIQQLPLIQTLQNCGLTIQVGGGIRSLASAQACIAAGISKIVIGSIAVTNPTLTAQIIEQIQAKNIVLALDVNIKQGVAKTAIHGWQTATNSNLWDLVSYYQQLGITEILCTDIACDGMMNGPNFNLYEQAIERFPEINWQASGGIHNHNDIEKLSSLGLAAAVLGRILYEGNFDLSSYLTKEELC